MALHTDSVDTESACLEVLDDLNISVAATWYVHAVVVEVELCVRISLACTLKCKRDELLAEDLIEEALSV